MIRPLILTVLGLFASYALAQSVDVKGLDTSNESSTTIEIKKNKKDVPEAKWTVEEGSADVEGEPSPSTKEARQSWKKACNDWKTEFREDNKENKVLNVNCGTVTCAGDAGNKSCSSKASYKVKTRVD